MRGLSAFLVISAVLILMIFSGCDFYIKPPVEWKSNSLTFQATENTLFRIDLMDYVEFTSTPVFILKEHPSWIELSGNVLKGIPRESNANPEEKITVAASSEGFENTLNISVKVEFIPKIIDINKSLVWNIKKYRSYKIKAYDKNPDDKLKFSATNLPEWLSLKNDGTLEGTPTSSPKREIPVEITVSDENMESTGTIYIIVNIPPKWIKPLKFEVDENTAETFDLTDYVEDEYYGKLSFQSVDVPVLKGVNVSVSGTGLLVSTDYTASGVYYMKFSVNDGYLDDPVVAPATLIVNNVDRPPVIEIPDQEMDENSSLTLNLASYTTDPDEYDDPGKFTYGVDGNDLPKGHATAMVNGTVLEIEADYDSAGVYTLRVWAIDSEGKKGEGELTLTIKNVNRPPISKLPETLSATLNEKFSYDLNEYFEDPDDDCLTISLISDLDWVTISSTITDETTPCYSYTLEGTPSESGSFSIQFEVSDEESTITAQSTIVVSE